MDPVEEGAWRSRRLRCLANAAIVLALICIGKFAYDRTGKQVHESVAAAFAAGSETVSKPYTDWKKSRAKHRTQLALAEQTTELPTVDSVTVYALDFDKEPVNKPFPIRLRGDKVEILRKTRVTCQAAAELTQLWRTRRFEPDSNSCHGPIYGLRFYAKGKLLFETSLCWYSRSFVAQDGHGAFRLFAFHDDDHRLLDRLFALLPHDKRLESSLLADLASRDYWMNHNFPRAMQELDRAANVDASNPAVEFARGHIRREVGDRDGAIAAFSRCIDLNPTVGLYYELRADLRVETAQLSGALEDYRRAVEYCGHKSKSGECSLCDELLGSAAKVQQALDASPQVK